MLGHCGNRLPEAAGLDIFLRGYAQHGPENADEMVDADMQALGNVPDGEVPLIILMDVQQGFPDRFVLQHPLVLQDAVGLFSPQRVQNGEQGNLNRKGVFRRGAAQPADPPDLGEQVLLPAGFLRNQLGQGNPLGQNLRENCRQM